MGHYKKDSEDKRSFPELIQSIRSITSGFDKTNRNTFFNHSSSAPSPFTVSLLRTTANSISNTNTVLPDFDKTNGKKRVVMVDQQCRTLQWPIKYTITGTSPYWDRCIQKSLGNCMSRDQNSGSMVQDRTGSKYQPAGTSGNNVCHLDIYQNVENASYTYPGRQHDSLELFAENGRDKESSLTQISKKISEFLLGLGIIITAEHLPRNLYCQADW